MPAFKKTRIQVHKPLVDLLADISHHPLTKPGHDIGTGKGTHSQQYDHPHKHQHRLIQHIRRSGCKTIIHQQTHTLPYGQ